jgi:hypothetical protein
MDDKGKVEKIENEKTKAQDAITKFTEKMGDDQYIDKLVAME